MTVLAIAIASLLLIGTSAGPPEDSPPGGDAPTTRPADGGDADDNADAGEMDADDGMSEEAAGDSGENAVAGDAEERDADAERQERLARRRAQREAEREAEESVRQLRQAIGKHFSDVRLIHTRFLVAGERDGNIKKFDEGRRRILALKDPLAIPAIIEILSKGSPAVRRIMIEALDQFTDHDDTTAYLIVVALVDPDPLLRDAAAIALLKRKSDGRIVQELRRALDSDEEAMLRNAATALGVLGDRSVVPDLIDRLSMEIIIEVPVSRESIFNGIGQAYVGGFRAKVAPGVAQIEPIVSTVSSGVALGMEDEGPIIEYKTVHRTEVQEALIALTGVNHGFDGQLWREWWEQNKD